MIVYEPNQHFLGDILHLAKSWTMVKIMRMVLLMGVYAGAVSTLMMLVFPDHELMDASIFSFLGIIILWIGFWLSDRLTPYQLWKEIITEKNQALATVVGSMALGISIIIAAAIH